MLKRHAHVSATATLGLANNSVAILEHIFTSNSSNVLAVPIQAIVEEEDRSLNSKKHIVFKYDNGVAKKLSVDTIRFYQKRRLLPPPVREGRIGWYGPDHADRLRRIRDLQTRGFSLAVIRRLVDGELDAAASYLGRAALSAG